VPGSLQHHGAQAPRRVFHHQLREARLRGAYVLLGLGLSVACGMWWRVELMYGVLRPILPLCTQWVYLDLTEGFLLMWMVACTTGVLVTLPLGLYQGWCYWAPGWYVRTRGARGWRLWALGGWMVSGGLCVFLVLLPSLCGYFLTFQVLEGPWSVVWVPRLTTFLSYGLRVAWLTVLVSGLVWCPWWVLSRWRGALVWAGVLLASVLSPPDVVSQWLVVMYLWGLLELALMGGILAWVRSGKPA
jgi:Sec-independent protein secretion pathway component TatC